MSIPFIDLKKQYQLVEKDIKAAVNKVLDHGQYIMGPEVAELEEALSKYIGVKHAIGCSSGTEALLMPLLAYDIGPGDAVFTTPFTFIATAEVISFFRATPVFVDIDPVTYNIDPALLKEAIQTVKKEGKLRPRVILPVDLFGLPADYDAINAIAEEDGLIVLEDAAQSFGASYKGRMACSLGHTAATSFFPAKPLGCYGDGGAIFTNDDDMVEKLRSIRVHGQGQDKYQNVRLGLNGRLDTIQAAILLIKLALFPKEMEKRQQVAAQYNQRLAGLVVTPKIPDGYVSCWAQYSILSDRRDLCRAKLQEAGIPTAIYYPIPLHLQGAFADLGYKRGDFPLSEATADKIFSLPFHPYLVESEVDQITDVIRKALA